MFKFKNPANFYSYILTEIIDENYLFVTYHPSIDLVYGDHLSIFESRKKIANYCYEFYRPHYSENQWKFFPIIYQFDWLDINSKEQIEFYSGKFENDAEMQASILKKNTYDMMLPELRKCLKKSKEEILEYYLDENSLRLKETITYIEYSIQSDLNVLDFMKESLKSYQSNSDLHELIVIQQHHLLDNCYKIIQKYINYLHHFMKTYCEEELELFEQALLKFSENHTTINA